MKKILMLFFAIFAITLTANATDYLGNVDSVRMGSKTPTVDQQIIFSVTGDRLHGDFDIKAMFPPHHIILNAQIIQGQEFSAQGTAIVFGVKKNFDGMIKNFKIVGDILSFRFEGKTGDKPIEFNFTGSSQEGGAQ